MFPFQPYCRRRGRNSLVLPARIEQVHCALSESSLVSLGRIFFCFFDRIPTEDRHELMGARPVVCGDGRACFAQTVRRTVVQLSLIAPVAELVAE